MFDTQHPVDINPHDTFDRILDLDPGAYMVTFANGYKVPCILSAIHDAIELEVASFASHMEENVRGVEPIAFERVA